MTVVHFPTKDPMVCAFCGSETWRLWEHDDCDQPHCWDCLDKHIHPKDFRLGKEEAECCNAKRDALGRLPVGYCGPDCARRPDGGDVA